MSVWFRFLLSGRMVERIGAWSILDSDRIDAFANGAVLMLWRGDRDSLPGSSIDGRVLPDIDRSIPARLEPSKLRGAEGHAPLTDTTLCGDRAAR